jgi:hypothetical protein
MEEEFRPVKGFEGLYEIGSHGSVKSFYNSGRKYLAGAINKSGYRVVTLSKGAVTKTFRINRLVAAAFIENPLGLEQVNHKNGNPLNNRTSNLEWVTQSENIIHSIRKLGGRHGFLTTLAKLSFEEAEEIRILSSFGASRKVLAEAYSVNPTTIHRILHGEIWPNWASSRS